MRKARWIIYKIGNRYWEGSSSELGICIRFLFYSIPRKIIKIKGKEGVIFGGEADAKLVMDGQ